MKNLEKIHICLKWGKNIGHCMRRPKYVILLPVTLNCPKSALFEWNGIRLFRGGINVTRTRRSVSLYSPWPMFWRSTGTLWVIVNVNIELSHCAHCNATSTLKTLFFYVLLTVNLGIIFVNNQLDAQFFFSCMFISILYMFRAAMCPSSGELIVPTRHLVYVTLYRWPFGVQVWMSLIQTCTPNGVMYVHIIP
jgi:hypothetical protein